MGIQRIVAASSDEDVARPEGANDQDLIRQVRAGDEKAFGRLYERHYEAALHVARRYTAGTRTSAEDLASDAFAQVLSALQRDKGPDESFRAYLYTVMRNAMQAASTIDAKSVTVDDFEPIQKLNVEEAVDPAITRFEASVVRSAFAAIPERWQSVLWYSDIEGMKPAEVGPILGLTPHGVSMLRKRAREGLRTAYVQAHVGAVAPDSACAGFASKLGAFERGTLGTRESSAIAAHIATCADCKGMHAEAKDVARGLLYIIALFFLGGSAHKFFGTGITPRSVPMAAAAAPANNSTMKVIGAAGVVAACATLFSTGAAAIPADESSAAGAARLSRTQKVLVAAVTVVTAVVIVVTVLFNNDWQDAAITTSGLPKVAVDGAVPLTRDRDAFGDDWGFDDSADAEMAPEPPVIDPLEPLLPEVPAVPVAPIEPVEPLEPVEPIVPAAPVNLIAGGGFDSPWYGNTDGKFPAGAEFDGWTLEYEGDWHINVLKIWTPEMGEPGATNHAPFDSGPWARLVGNITQTFATEVGKTYLLEYDTRATSFGAGTGAGFNGGSPANVRINGDVVDSFVTLADPVISPRSLSFTATSESTTLSFVTTGVHVGPDGVKDGAVPVGLDNISVTEAPTK